MPIRQTNLSWSAYKKAAKTIKTINPSTTPQQIIGRLGYPVKDGVRIRITSDGQGGVKERNVTAQQARERVRQKRLRIQTGTLSPEDLQKSRQTRDLIRATGDEADHINESWLIGEQLERLEAEGGDVQAALTRLKKAGYQLGNMPGNLQRLSPEANKEKYQQSRKLQEYLGSREQLGQSPSARRPDLIQTGYKPPELGGYQVEKPPVTVTGGSIRYKPQRLEGFATDAYVPSQPPITPREDLSEPILTFDTTPQPMDPLKTIMSVGGGIILGFGEALKNELFGFR